MSRKKLMIFCTTDCGNTECEKNKEYFKNMTELGKTIIVQKFNKCENWRSEDERIRKEL